MQKKSKEAIKARNLALLFLGICIVLGGLFINEYARAKDVTLLGRVPLLGASLITFIYFSIRYLKLR